VRVLAVLDVLNLGGAENLLATLARVGPSQDLTLDVVSLAAASSGQATWLPVLQEAGLRPRLLDISRLIQPQAVPRLTRAIRESKADIVHAHLEYAATLAPVAAWLAGRPCVCTYHHVPVRLPIRDQLRERVSVAVASRSAKVIFVSKASQDGFAASYRARSNWTVLHNGIDLQEFRPRCRPLPAELGIPPGAPVVTLVGRLGDGKGHEHALAAWPSVLASVPEARLLLVGDGGYEDALRRQAVALGVGQRVVFAGRRTDVAAILNGSTLSCLPTRNEALPTALIEAAACGIPAVASAVTGVLEVVKDGETGLLVPYGDDERLASALVALLQDADRRTLMGRAARRLAEERFDAGVWAARLGDIYRTALGWPAVAARPREHDDTIN